MSDAFIPFNHQPVSVGRSTGTYTVPSGKYARVTVSAYVSARTSANSSGSGFTISSYNTHGDTHNEVFHYWLSAGDSITFSGSSASGNATAAIPGGAGLAYTSTAHADTTLSVDVNGNSSASLLARAIVNISVTNGGAAPINFVFASFGGSFSCTFFYEEYNVIS